jgi:hypothetical protein
MSNSISSALGISDVYNKRIERLVSDKWDSEERVSDSMIAAAEDIRMDEFGETNEPISMHEKRMIMIGYYIGVKQAESQLQRKAMQMLMDKHMEELKAKFGRSIREDEDED